MKLFVIMKIINFISKLLVKMNICWPIHLQDIQDVDELISSSEQFWQTWMNVIYKTPVFIN